MKCNMLVMRVERPLRSATRSLTAVALILVLCTGLARAALKDTVYETVLGNGLKVILLENHKAPLVTFQVWYRVGSRNEAWGKTGLSHMLEHMMFKGTTRVSAKEFSRILEENGGNNNAFTSTDFTAYFENIYAEKVDIPIMLESDRMQNLLLREEDFRTELQVVMEERRLRTEDNPEASLAENMEATAFQIQPYHWPVIGCMVDLQGFTIEDVKAYHAIYYSPSNAFLVVAGDFDRKRVLASIDAAFGSIPSGKAPDQVRNLDEPQRGERRIVVEKEALLPSIIMGYHVPNLKNDDSYALEVVEGILSAGKSSRLYRGLVRERQIALNVDADHALLSKDPHLFTISVDPLPGKGMEEVEKAIDQEVDRLGKEPVDAQELEKVKNQLEASFIYGQDSIFSQAMLLAQYEIAGDWRLADDYVPKIRNVSAQDVMRAVARYLSPENRTVAILKAIPPTKETPTQELGGKERIIR